MNLNDPETQKLLKRLEEQAQRSWQQDRLVFTEFLTPAQQQLAVIAANRTGIGMQAFGGYELAENRVVAFGGLEEAPEIFPLVGIQIAWPHQSAPAHQDLLGSLMGLGLKRSAFGDIVLLNEMAYCFCLRQTAPLILEQWATAGRVHLSLTLCEKLPNVQPPPGREVRDTVKSLRLDAVVASGFALSRSQAADLVRAGQVKLAFLPNDHVDAQVVQGDVISLRGYGRIRLLQVGQPTRKERYPVVFERLGEKR